MRQKVASWVGVLVVTIIANSQALTPRDEVVLQWARELAPITSSGIDVPEAVTTDSYGNIYVAGKSEGQSSDYDYLTVKYNSAGIEEWRVRYDGSYHGADFPNAITVDDLMNVYVTGMSATSDTSSTDIVTVKYSADGIQQWVARHAGNIATQFGNGTDVPYDVAVDASHNVYVTGFQSTDFMHDFVTLKYNSSGVQEWVATYDGPVGRNDEARSVELDASGNVYVTGASIDSVDQAIYGQREFGSVTTIKYRPDGEVVWLSRYSPDDTSHNAPVDMKIGPGGELYIVANTWKTDNIWIDMVEDVITLKYSDDGSLLWSRRYTSSPFGESSGDIPDRATGLALDESGNVYVTGGCGDVQSYRELADSIFTIKYDSDGTRLWVRMHDKGSSAAVLSAGIAVDEAGNAFIAGSHVHLSQYPLTTADSTFVIRYSSVGTPVWTDYDGASDDTTRCAKGIALDSYGHPLLISEVGLPEETDMVIRSYSTDGSLDWTAKASGPGNTTAFVTDAFVDEEGNTYVTGGIARPKNKMDQLTMKVNPSGDLAWSATYNSISGWGNHASSIAVDNEKNVFVMGNIQNGQSPYGRGTAIIKYDSDGAELWRTEVDSMDSFSLTLGRDGTVFFGGSDLVKLDPEGNVEWRIDHTYYYFDNLAVDDSGNIYSASWEYLKKFDGDGNELWSSTSGGSALAVDDSNFVYVSWSDYYNESTSRFTPVGERMWTVPYGGPQMAISGDNLYVSGSGPIDALTRQGEHLWTQAHPITWFRGNNIAIGKFGAAFSTYTNWDVAESMNLEIIAVRYTPAGNETWTGAFDGSLEKSYQEMAIGADSLGNIFVIGERWTNSFTTVPVIVKYGPSSPVTSTEDARDSQPHEFALFQNYPNPFNPITEIRFQIPESAHVALQIFDILGREITTLVDEYMQPGSYSRTVDGTQLSSGTYFYRLMAGSRVTVKRMIFLK